MLSLAALALPSLLRAGPELEALRTIAVQDGGRTKPLDTFARETARRVTGARAFGFESVAGLDPVEWIVAMMADPAKWRDERFIRVTHAGLRAGGGTSPGQGHDPSRCLLVPGAGPERRLPEGRGQGSREASARSRGQARPHRARDLDSLRHALDRGRALLRRGPADRPPPDGPHGRLVLDRRSRQDRGGTRPADQDPDRGPGRAPTRTATARASRPRPSPSTSASPSWPRPPTPRPRPADRGPLQQAEALPTGLDPLPLRLPGLDRELPPRLAPASAGRASPSCWRAS